MVIYNGVITFGSNAIQITDPTNGVAIPAGTMARKIEIEPLRANTHVSYVGNSSLTNNGTGVAVQELAMPSTTLSVPMDRFIDAASSIAGIDPTQYYVHGTSGEKAKVTIISA